MTDTSPEQRVHDLLVIGGGPAGAATAYWAATAGLDTVMIGRQSGRTTVLRQVGCGLRLDTDGQKIVGPHFMWDYDGKA